MTHLPPPTSNRTSVTTASGTTTYSYDDRNRLDVVKLNGALQADYDYDAASRLTKTTFGNGTEEIRVYDTLNRLKELTSKRGAIELSKYVYTLDKVGNRKTATETVNGQNRSLAYTYDDLYRLTDEAITDGVNGNRTSNYTYDFVGNRQTKTINGVTTTYAYDGNDRLRTEKVGSTVTATYDYDNNGSTTQKVENGVTTTYVWNDEKRLVSATVGTTQVEYLYNDQGIRVASKQNGVETRYLLDEGMVANVWEEYAPNGTVQASYVYGNDLITQTQAGQTSYYLVDGLGSTRLITDAQGQVLNAYGYEAFGETVSQSGTASNKYQYAGEQFDAALGDYYLRQRFYDTSSGRFGRMDTYEGNLSNPITLNKYVYANSNPIIGRDPTGLFTLQEVALTTAIIGNAVVTALTPASSFAQGISDSAARNIERRMVQQAQSKTVNQGGDAVTFAELMQFAASEIPPLLWVMSKEARIDFLKMAVDIYTDDDPIMETILPIAGKFGNNGSRRDRPAWLLDHYDDMSGSGIFNTGQVNDEGSPEFAPNGKATGNRVKISGRRDHYLSNAMVGFAFGALGDIVRQEDMQSDMIVNRLGRRFGLVVSSGALPQNLIYGWVLSDLWG